VHDVTYDDIRVEYGEGRLQPQMQKRDDERYVDRGNGAWMSGPLGVWLSYHFEYSAHGTRRGHVRNVLFRNIRVTAERMPGSSLVGYDQNHRVSGVVVDGIYLNGRRLSEAEACVHRGNAFVDPIVFR